MCEYRSAGHNALQLLEAFLMQFAPDKGSVLFYLVGEWFRNLRELVHEATIVEREHNPIKLRTHLTCLFTFPSLLGGSGKSAIALIFQGQDRSLPH